MIRAGASHWLHLIARYSAGQSAILAINLISGFLVLRFLSLEEYAIYILASLLQSIGSLGTDLGMSQGVVSLGAPLSADKAAFGRLVRGAVALRARLFLVVLPIVLVVAYLVMRNNAASLVSALTVTFLALAIAWMQQSSSIATAVLNANHDSSGLLFAGAITATSRLILIAGLVSAYPNAVVAMAINLVGISLNAGLLWRRCRSHLAASDAGRGAKASPELIAFMRPLLPGIIYYVLQGNISTFLLSLAGTSTAIAEVGALSRLGQIISLLMLLNGFFVQPYFARIRDRRRFAIRSGQMLLVLALGFAAVTASALVAPQAWLMVLGSKYESLSGELVLALVGALLSLIGATLYTMVIATRRTRGQWLQIAIGAGAQAIFVSMFGINNTRDALVLNMIPAAAYAALQMGLLIHILLSWKRDATHH